MVRTIGQARVSCCKTCDERRRVHVPVRSQHSIGIVRRHGGPTESCLVPDSPVPSRYAGPFPASIFNGKCCVLNISIKAHVVAKFRYLPERRLTPNVAVPDVGNLSTRHLCRLVQNRRRVPIEANMVSSSQR